MIVIRTTRYDADAVDVLSLICPKAREDLDATQMLMTKMMIMKGVADDDHCEDDCDQLPSSCPCCCSHGGVPWRKRQQATKCAWLAYQGGEVHECWGTCSQSPYVYVNLKES